MACFTTEYDQYTGSVLAVDSCQIGQDIWVVIRFAGYRFYMYKWNIDTTKWTRIEPKNRRRLDFNNGLADNVMDFVICSSNGILYMWRRNPQNSTIMTFDTTKLRWTRLDDLRITKPPQSSILVLNNNDIFIKSGNQKIITFTFDSRSAHGRELENSGKVDLCEVDGVVYIVDIRQNGRRCVLKYDDEIEEILDMNKEYDTSRSYLEHSGSEEEYQTFNYGYNNKIYQGIKLKNRLVLDCYDIETKKYHTIFDTKITGCDFISISGNDKEAYMIYRIDGIVSVRVIDMKPTLEILSLISVADHVVKLNYIENVMNMLPYELRRQFENITDWKKYEYFLHKKQCYAQSLELMTNKLNRL